MRIGRLSNCKGPHGLPTQDCERSHFSGLNVLALVVALGMFCTHPLEAQTSVLTSRNDNCRTGQNVNKPFLNSTNVNSATFAKLGSYNVDGCVVAQPLYMPNVT